MWHTNQSQHEARAAAGPAAAQRERQHCRPSVHALKGAIMDADIYGHREDKREEIRLDERQLEAIDHARRHTPSVGIQVFNTT
jgi:hypothetical protein